VNALERAEAFAPIGLPLYDAAKAAFEVAVNDAERRFAEIDAMDTDAMSEAEILAVAQELVAIYKAFWDAEQGFASLRMRGVRGCSRLYRKMRREGTW
jgi:hypothetical protein